MTSSGWSRKDGDDLGVREFAVPDWKVGDTIALRDEVYRVYDVVYLDDDLDVRGILMLAEPRARKLMGLRATSGRAAEQQMPDRTDPASSGCF